MSQQPLRAAGADVVVVPRAANGLDLRAVMTELARRECNEIHAECGPTLAGALLQAGLLDELVIYMAPILLGDKARSLFELPELKQMQDRHELEVVDTQMVGRDWRIRLRSCPIVSPYF